VGGCENGAEKFCVSAEGGKIGRKNHQLSFPFALHYTPKRRANFSHKNLDNVFVGGNRMGLEKWVSDTESSFQNALNGFWCVGQVGVATMRLVRPCQNFDLATKEFAGCAGIC